MKKILTIFTLIVSLFVVLTLTSCVVKPHGYEEYLPYISRFEEEQYIIDLVDNLKESVVVVKHDTGHGSGVIYKKESISGTNDKLYYVLTNNHVVNNATNINVYFGPKEQYSVIDLKTIPTYDIAVVRFKTTKDIPVISAKQLDNNKGVELKAAQKIIVIGTPQDLNKFNYVTMGTLTLTSYTYNGIKDLSFMIDAAINPGNSGGPVFNLNGDLIGLATAKIPYISEPDGDIPADGLGYCISLNFVGPSIREFTNSDFTPANKTPRLGVTIMNLSDFLNQGGELGLDITQIPSGVNGVVVTDLDPERNAYGHVLQYDIITHCDGQIISNRNDLSRMLGTNPAFGDSHTLTVVRVVGGVNQTFQYVIVLS
jgi:S1-C subfamily serine protease